MTDEQFDMLISAINRCFFALGAITGILVAVAIR